jgi:hypothetical protein
LKPNGFHTSPVPPQRAALGELVECLVDDNLDVAAFCGVQPPIADSGRVIRPVETIAIWHDSVTRPPARHPELHDPQTDNHAIEDKRDFRELTIDELNQFINGRHIQAPQIG